MRNWADKHTYEYLKLTYLIRYMGDAFFYTFLFVFLASIGVTTAELGLLSAVIPIAALIGNILFSKLAKDLNKNRRLMVLLTTLEMIVALLLTLFPQQPFYFYLIIITFASLFNGPFYSLLDGYSGTYILARKKQYSSMRIMGTLGYVFAPFVGGLLVDHTSVGYPIIFASATLFFTLTIFLTLFLPKPLPFNNSVAEVSVRTEKMVVLKNKPLLLHLLFSFLIIPLSIVSDNFYGVYLTDNLGMTTGVYGALFSCAIIVEVLMFIFIIFKKNMFKSPAVAYFIIGFFVLLRPLSIAFNFDQTGIFMLGIFRGIAWGYYIVFHVRYLSSILPLKFLTPALFLTSIAGTVGRIIYSLSIGEALHTYSYQKVFTFISVFLVFSTLLLVCLALLERKKRTREEESSLIQANNLKQ